MRLRDVRNAVLLLALAVPATPAAEVSAQAGVQYSRYYTRGVAGDTTDLPHLDIDLRLDARGFIVSPDVMDYALRVGWGRVSNGDGAGETSTTDMLSYSGHASFFDNAVSPIALAVFGERGQTDFSTSTAPDAFGRGYATSAGGTLALRGDGIPAITTRYTWRTAESEIAGQPLRSFTTHTLDSILSFGTPAFNLSASYAGEYREGAWGTDNYTNHGVTMSGRGWIGSNVLSFESSATFVLPDELLAGTFEQRTTSVSATMSAGELRAQRLFSYSYDHTTVESPGVPTTEATHQGVRYQGDHFAVGQSFVTRWLVDASAAETRSGDGEPFRATGETLGVSLSYKGGSSPSSFELSAGPRVSLLQSQGNNAGGFGANAGVSVVRRMDAQTLQAGWHFGYGQNLFANTGWNLSQELSASLSGPLSTTRYNANLRASAFRTHSPATGDGAGRTIEATATLSGSRASLSGRASLAQGMLGATTQFTSDGLILPAPFDSTVVDASLGAGMKIFSGLSSTLRFHLARSDIPGRPVLHEASVAAGLSYQYGALGFTLEDRYGRVETDAGWVTSNLAMITVYRSLTW